MLGNHVERSLRPGLLEVEMIGPIPKDTSKRIQDILPITLREMLLATRQLANQSTI